MRFCVIMPQDNLTDPANPSNPTISIPIEQLVLDDKNPRKGRVRQLSESLKEFGQHRDAVIRMLNTKTDDGLSRYEVIIGNHMVMAAKMIGWTYVDCKVVTDDDIKAMRRKVADNRLGEIGGWDEGVLKEILNRVGTDIPGIDQSFTNKLFADKGIRLKEEPVYPIVPEFSETYQAVVVFASNETDWTYLKTFFGLEKKKSYKSSATKLCHVVTADELRKVLDGR